MFSLDTCAAGIATQRTHVQALLMLLFVNSCCLKRGPTTLLFLNTVNLKNNNRLVSIKTFKTAR